MIPGPYGFVAQLNEGRHLKKRPTEFRVDKVLQPFDGNKFNFTEVGQEEVLFQFEASRDGEVQFFPNAPIEVESSPSVVAINVICTLQLLVIDEIYPFLAVITTNVWFSMLFQLIGEPN